MRLLYFIPRCYPAVGGAEYFVHRMALHAAADGHRVAVLARYAASADRDILGAAGPRDEAPQSISFGSYTATAVVPRQAQRVLLRIASRLRFYPATAPTAYRLFRHVYRPLFGPFVQQADLVHSATTGWSLYGFVLQELAAARGIPHFVTPAVHPGTWGDGPIDWHLYRRVTGLLVDTEYEARYIGAHGIDPTKIRAIGMGCDPPHEPADAAGFRRRLGAEGSLVLYLGRMAAAKGHAELRAAAPIVWERHPNTWFVFAGPSETGDRTVNVPGTSPSVRLPGDKRIVHVGVLSEPEKQAALAAADVLCLPSSTEAFGIVLLEAWSHKKPVVVGPAPALREVVRDGVDGLLVDREPTSIARALVHLLDNPSAAQAMGQAGYAKAMQRFTWRHVYERCRAAYLSALVAARGNKPADSTPAALCQSEVSLQ